MAFFLTLNRMYATYMLRRVHTAPKIKPHSNWFETGSRQCALIAFTLHFSRHRTSTLHLRMLHDCHARAVLLVKHGSSTIDNKDVSLPSMVPRRVAVLLVLLWAFLRVRRTHRELRISKERRFLHRRSGSASLHRARSAWTLA